MYDQMILKATGCTPDEARHVEGYMRLTFGTLDGLGADFKREARSALKDARLDPKAAEDNARSYGLRP